MNVIGITGGVGAGKSAIIDFVLKNYNAKAVFADDIAKELMSPEGECFGALSQELEGDDVMAGTGGFDTAKLSALLFEDEKKRELVNGIVHPAVKDQIEKHIAFERQMGEIDILIVEAALLIEGGFDKICDELIYIYASEQTRAKRLMDDRGYSFRRVQQIFDSQLDEKSFRDGCGVTIDNDSSLADAEQQMEEAIYSICGIELSQDEEKTQAPADDEPIDYVFGLDIGTRNVVGTVGYKDGEDFIVVAQYVKQHQTRAMLDGQIHDIAKVARTIEEVKQALEFQINEKLHEVCIAAAGRVLKTVTVHIEYEFEEEKIVEGEDVHNLEMLGIEKAQEILKKNNDTHFKFYSVGYSVIKYFLNEDVFSSLISHKAEKIAEDIVVTFLPEDVVDGLYTAVGQANLEVANLTLEPIAAMNVAIPQMYRMLNIALVDVGAGTSDISITRDGSIVSYGMIPLAGDEVTDVIVQNYLVDFKTAERIKQESGIAESVTYEDIMNIEHTVPSSDVIELTRGVVEKVTGEIAKKIKELNADKSVSAVFVVGGGGKISGFTENLAKLLELPKERVALRGEEVLKEVYFKQSGIKKDPLLVTPIGICYNYYEQKNNFIFVRFNGERLKLYDNSKLTIVDAAMQAGFKNEYLFPRRGQALEFAVNGKKRIVRGEPGESAVIKVDGRVVSMNTPLEPNMDIEMIPSTAGEKARYTIRDLPEYEDARLRFIVNGKNVVCQRYVEANRILKPAEYEIQPGDVIEIRNYYTVAQLAQFMDLEIDTDRDIYVNNRPEGLDTIIYDNFSVDWTVLSVLPPEREDKVDPYNNPEDLYSERDEDDYYVDTIDADEEPAEVAEAAQTQNTAETAEAAQTQNTAETAEVVQTQKTAETAEVAQTQETAEAADASAHVEINGDAITEDGAAGYSIPDEIAPTKREPRESGGIFSQENIELTVYVNGKAQRLTGKSSYIFVDIFDFIDFDLNDARGRTIVTNLNGVPARYGEFLSHGDKLDIYWKDK